MDYIKDRARFLKEEIKEYLSEDTELFLRDFYHLCYNEFLMFEFNKNSADEIPDEEEVFNTLLNLKITVDNTPCSNTRSYSTENHHWYVSDIFKIEPKRYGVQGDEIIWKYLELYFTLHSISLDIVSVEYIIDKARDVLEIYYQYAKHDEREILSKYWDEALDGLIRARYECLFKEMNLLK